jgi:anaerobic magnesium-protoporphyrin IX monomethyl ester cyclase
MRVLLVAPPIMDDFGGTLRPIAMDAVRECPPYGVLLLQAYLRESGHDPVLADLIAAGTDRIDGYEDVLAEAGLVGIGATSMSWPTAVAVIRQVRERRPDVPIVVGGIHPTMFDDYLLMNFPIDFVVRGEGEVAMVALANALDNGRELGDVPNLSWRDPQGRVVRNPVARQLTDTELGNAPLPDFSQLAVGQYKGLSIESSRGCAFDCSFCSTSYRRSYRSLQPEVFVDRLQKVMMFSERTESDFVHVIDDEFSMNLRRALAITDVLRDRGLRPRLVYDSRANDLLFPGYVESIAEFTGQFLVGAECGYDEGLKRVGKGTTTEMLEKAARKLDQHGIASRADFSFILGLPWESVTEVRHTLAFAFHLYSTYGVRLLLQWYCQIPGSRLWQEQRDSLAVSETMYNDFGFFRDIYLFRTGVKLSPREIWEINDLVDTVRTLSGARHPHRSMIDYSHPSAISLFFPQELVNRQSSALGNLRVVAKARERQTSARERQTSTAGTAIAPG